MAFNPFLESLWNAPSPWIGGILGGLLTGGLFGWITHVRGIRPILIFYRDEKEETPKWRMKNIGQGPAMHIRVSDYKSDTHVSNRVLLYPIRPGEERPLTWVTGGNKLIAEYTDAYGRRWFKSIGLDNDTRFGRVFKSFFRRPPKKHFENFQPEIHVLMALAKPKT
jgi:hypothetical protein